jgi:multiple sugar transport system permease protein
MESAESRFDRSAPPPLHIASRRGAANPDLRKAVRAARRRRRVAGFFSAILGIVIVVWSVMPIYNMIMVSLSPHSIVFRTQLWPRHPSLRSYSVVLAQKYWYLKYFWEQFGRSVFLAAMTVLLTLSIGSLASYSVGRLRVKHGWLITNAALLTYVVPASFLAIPFYRLMAKYGMTNNIWAVIAALVAFATPYAIFVFQQYGRSIPLELDEAARIDGASPIQIYFRIYLPLMAPALVAVGTFALLLGWNEFLYQFLLLSAKRSMTVPVALVQFLNSDEVPWNYMMATAVIYALPPAAIYYAFHRYMAAGLTMGGVKG